MLIDITDKPPRLVKKTPPPKSIYKIVFDNETILIIN